MSSIVIHSENMEINKELLTSLEITVYMFKMVTEQNVPGENVPG